MDEFLCEVKDGYHRQVGDLMCEAYKYASDKCFEWHKREVSRFANSRPPLFAFDLDGGYKESELGSKGNYLQTH